MAGKRGFWGSVEAGGSEVMVNLRLVRYARPTQAGTRLYFDGGDAIDVAAGFDAVSHRLYQAYDDAEEGGGSGDGDKSSDKGKG